MSSNCLLLCYYNLLFFSVLHSYNIMYFSLKMAMIWLVIYLLAASQLSAVAQIQWNINSKVIVSSGSNQCPLQAERKTAVEEITNDVMDVLQLPYSVLHQCGDGLWCRVAYLNMSDPSQQCPSAWREYNTGGVRACGRPVSNSASCPGTLYVTSRQQYNRVCGRATGYQYGSPDAFGYDVSYAQIDSYYVHGVSITHGTPRNHIWTYAAGVSEGGYSVQRDNCPCSKPNDSLSVFPPAFVGENYYCESGNPTNTFIHNHLYTGDLLWDGEQCEGECCSNGKSPPWFSVELPNPTTDDVEVRICNPEGTYDDTLVQLLELYIQLYEELIN